MIRKRLFIITGDASGDVHGSAAIRELQQLDPDLEIQAVGGDQMAATGIRIVYPQHRLGVLGMGVITAIPSHFWLGKQLMRHFETWTPDAVLLIDYGEFNLWMARQLKAKGIRVFYYIPPQIWASRPGRIHRIQRDVDHVFCIFPFEKPLYDAAGVPATFVGHPLVASLPPPPDRGAFCSQHGLNAAFPIIGLFPGSRRMEVKGLLRPMIEAMPLIQQLAPTPVQFVLAKSPAVPDDLFHRLLAPVLPITQSVPFQILSGQNYEILALSQAILAASGTVTLEAALYKTPAVISYKLSRLSYWLFRRFATVRMIGLPNLLSGLPQGFLPELLMDAANPEAFAQAIVPYLSNTPERLKTLQVFEDIRHTLGDDSTANAVANSLLAQMRADVLPMAQAHNDLNLNCTSSHIM